MPEKNGNGRIKLAKLEQRLCDHLEQNQYFREETGDKLQKILDKLDTKANSMDLREVAKEVSILKDKYRTLSIKVYTASGVLAGLGSLAGYILTKSLVG